MIHLNIDIGPLMKLEEELKTRLEAALQQAAQELTLQAHGRILEQVQEKLHSTREKYIDALGYSQVNANTWVINLDASAMFIEEGLPEHEMIDNLLKSKKTKTAKDGSRYLAVPFQQNKAPTQSTTAQQDLTATIKGELKRRNIPYGKLEKDKNGQVKTGTLHAFDIMTKPIKESDGPGMGKGPLGAVRQGPTGIPFLQGVRVIQKAGKGKDGKTNYSRHIMTFRIVSSKHRGTGRWVHPGLEARKFFDDAADWLIKEWNEHIGPAVMNQLTENL